MSEESAWRQRFAVQSVAWRNGLDWAVENVPFYCLPFLIFFWTLFFFVFARKARQAVVHHLAIILPRSIRLANHFRAFRTFSNFAWTLTETASYKLNKTAFTCAVEGAEFLDGLVEARGAIVLTAHMGSYDLGAALFTEKFQRSIRMVRAPEPDKLAAEHVDLALEQAGAGAVKVAYSGEGAGVSFELLNALREGEIVSMQGDRAFGTLASAPVELFGRAVSLPNGPFVLGLVTEAPIYPLFVVRTGYRRYKIIVREPVACRRGQESREETVTAAMQRWAGVLQTLIEEHWDQWYAFSRIL